MNIRLIKTLDAGIGRLAALSLPSRHGTNSVDMCSILIIRPGGIGDAVLLVPAIRVIKGHFNSAVITVLAERRNASVFTLCPEVDHVLLYDSPSGLFTALRGNYDAVIDSEQWHRLSAVVARLTRASNLIGYSTNERTRLFTHPVPYSHDDYEVFSFLRLLLPLGIDAHEPYGRFLTVPDGAIKKTDSLLMPLAGKPFVTVFPGASIPERRWGVDRFRQVAEMLAAFGIAVVVVGAGDDQEQGESIAAGGHGLNLAGQTSLSETAAIIDRGALLVSGDSGILHIAVGLDKPTVSLFGPGRSKKWAPCGDRHIVLNKNLSCSPCTTFGSTPRCTIGAKCMRNVSVEEVFDAVTILLRAEGILPSQN